MNYTIKKCSEDDLNLLREISYETYDDTFRSTNTPANMKAYLEQAFDLDKLRNELRDRNSSFYFLYSEEKLSGYLKINEDKAQTDVFDPDSLEVERIYIRKEFQGKGLGNILMKKAVEEAIIRKKAFLWLGVWEHNQNALEFYKRQGFYSIGTHSFFMGEEEQTDYIMRKNLTELIKDNG